MEISGIGIPSENTISRRAAIQQEDFLKVLLAQLQFQDPMEPLDNNEFIAQFAQLTNLEQTQQLNDKVETLTGLQAGGQAINLIGHTVEANTDTTIIVGNVVSVAFQNGVPILTLRTAAGEYITDISLGQIRLIR